MKEFGGRLDILVISCLIVEGSSAVLYIAPKEASASDISLAKESMEAAGDGLTFDFFSRFSLIFKSAGDEDSFPSRERNSSCFFSCFAFALRFWNQFYSCY